MIMEHMILNNNIEIKTGASFSKKNETKTGASHSKKINTIKHSYVLIFILILTVICLTGCGGKQGKLHKKKYVLKKVSREVPSEKYKFDRKEKVPDSDVSTEIYYFKSKDRDLEFRAINTRRPILFEANLYGKSLEIKYAEDVHKLYEPEINNILVRGGYNLEKDQFEITTFDELAHVAKVASQVDDVYKRELKYNSAEWMKEYPATKLRVSLMGMADDSVGNGNSTNSENKNSSINNTKKSEEHKLKRIAIIGGVEINGTWDYDSIYDYLCYKHASNIKDGKYEDATVPKRIMDKGHVSYIKNIYINGDNIAESGYKRGLSLHMINNTESSYYAGYCYALNDYIIPLDIAETGEDYAPQMMEEILSRLADSYTIEYGKRNIKWEKDGVQWETKADFSRDHHIASFNIYKNGQDYSIMYVTCFDFSSPVGPTYMVGIRVSDFADIFGLKVTVDEEDGSILFE